jgi:hypothetical protein
MVITGSIDFAEILWVRFGNCQGGKTKSPGEPIGAPRFGFKKLVQKPKP